MLRAQLPISKGEEKLAGNFVSRHCARRQRAFRAFMSMTTSEFGQPKISALMRGLVLGQLGPAGRGRRQRRSGAAPPRLPITIKQELCDGDACEDGMRLRTTCGHERRRARR
jgi:hypothetical protein